jgi:meckelin
MIPPARIWWGLYDNYNPFRWMLWLCFFGQLFRIGEILVEQCTMEMFFIDWEKSRGRLGGSSSKRAGGASSKVPVSAWRTMFVANEWNELQSCRTTNFELTLVATVFILVGCDMQYLATSAPLDTTPGPLNPVLRFANTTIWFMIAELIQIFWNWAIWRRCFREPKAQQFHDFCTMAKISVFLLPNRLHGFYLHARSPHEHADATMLQIAKDLKKQEDNLVLEDPMPDVPKLPGGNGPMYSSYELYLTRKFRKHYDDIFSSIRADEQRAARISGGSKSEGLPFLNSSSMPTEATEKATRRLTKFLKGFIDKTDNIHRNEFQHSNYMYRAFHWPTLTSEDVSYVYGDGKSQSMGFSQPRWTMVTFLGVEYDLFIFNVLTFAVIDLWVGDNLEPDYHTGAHVVSAFVTYLVEMLIRYIRDAFGGRNVNEKTLVDDRFLL